ncbi:GNAT family N-acetyltransferase [Marinomonas rhizomae]|uniref:Ribosomal protein S18 acetylase RimI-like enzyme n=1 Tax=Marinomonas rhizomae TaxID=491948 RepID=A0A366ITA7_9GAMM|nr:GNAT family N-acetyltransferase [Marinomonas rhizomae]RBP78003.1 ribosomal protein S18 acetylase RimI-like enzyme [Marinomonas rhizomae]RNF69023.1 GNAT family N-acetyltransferase [Marinomonas rhizomae]
MINIMFAEHSHLDNLAEIMRTTFHLACPENSNHDLQDLYISKHLNAKCFEQILNSEKDKVWVALSGKKAIGLAVLEHGSKDIAILSKLYVMPDYQGQGIAYNLYSSVFNYVQETGYSHLQLFVFSGNNRAKAFYKKQGFKLIGTDEFTMESEVHHDEIYEISVV